MKRLFCTLFLSGFIIMLHAQNNNIVNIKMKDDKCLQEGYQNPSQTPVTQSHVYLINQQPQGSGSSRAVTSVPLGSAGNLFTILSGDVNRVAGHSDLNTVIYIHRSDPDVFTTDNIGQYRYDVSYDGGATWTLNQGVLNPKGNQQTYAGRYPNVNFYNPVGNNDPDSAYLAYIGSWLPFDAGGSWDGHFTGVARLDNDINTFTENIDTLNNGDIEIARGMSNGTQGVFWAVNWENLSNTELDPSAVLVLKGVWNPNVSTVDWLVHKRIVPPFDLTVDGTAQAASLNMSFDPTGQFGWIVMLADVTAGGDNVLAPAFYKTTDGGDTWTGPIVVDLSTLDNVVSGLSVNPIPTTAFDCDIVVDLNGNPHVAVVVGSSGQDYAISTGSGAGMKIYSITYFSTGSADCKWQAIFLDDIQTLRGEITSSSTGAIEEDNRPQGCLSPDGTKVFFGWLDSDGTQTGGTNALPDFKTRAYDVTTGLATGVVNWTDGDPTWGGSALFASTAPFGLQSGGTFRIPTVFTQLNPATQSADDPTYFHYIQNIQYTNAAFTVDIYPPQITLNGSSPVTVVVGSPYNDQGVTATDNADGNITGSVVANTANVNTAVAGSYMVTYNVTDAAGNVACEATRVVNVVATPDNTAPTISITGASTVNVDVCDFFSDPGATASDNVDGVITNNIVVTSNLPDPLVPGTFTIDYDVTDGAGNVATTQTRTVNVSDLPPTITLNGGDTMNVEICLNFSDPSALAVDNCAGALTVTPAGSVDTDVVGSYTITYTATDGVNPPVTATRTVNVTPDATPPLLNIQGANPLYIYLGDTYTDPGATATDCVDGNVTGNITDNSSSVNPSARGNYTVSYNVSDAAGNSAPTATRVVVVNTEPDPDFTFTNNGCVVSFTNTSLYNATGWTWDFGDQFASTQQNPNHTYSQPGTYTVCMEARNVYNTAPFNKPAQDTCKTVTLTSCQQTGINDVVIENAFDVYPNPTNGLLTVEFIQLSFEKATVEIFDVVGKELVSFNLSGMKAGDKQTLDFSTKPEGVYIVRILTEEGIASKKVIVSR